MALNTDVPDPQLQVPALRRLAEAVAGAADPEDVRALEVLGAVSDGITVQSPDGGLLWANDAAAELLGYSSAAALLDRSADSVLARFEVLDAAGNTVPAARLPGRLALQGEDPPEVLLRWRAREIDRDRWSLVRARPVRHDDGRVRFAVSVFRDVTERQQAVEALRHSEERFALLASASRALLASSLDAQALAERLADVVVPVLADWCSVWEIEGDGQRRRIVVRLGERHGPELAGRLAAAPDPFAAHPLWETVTNGHSALVPDLRPWLDDHADEPALAGLNPTSVVAVPVVARSGVVGAMLLASVAPRSYSAVELGLAEDLGRRASQAVDIARAYQAEQRAREAAEEATARLTLLADLSLLLAGSLDIDELLRALQRRVQGVFADACIVDLVVEDGGTRRVTGVADGDARAEAVAAALEGRATFEPHAPGAVAGSRSASVVTVPVVGRTGPLGALTFVATGRSGLILETDDVALAEEIGRRAGVAIDNARLYAERSEAAATLTRALLPDRLPDVPGLELAARYRPAAAGVGGDFYDVVPMGGGQWLFAIADVCGKGAEAGSLTAMTRYTLRTLARNHRRPAELLEAANQALADALPDDRFWTAACAVVEPGVRSARVSLAVAGHPTPLVVRRSGEVGACGRPGMLIGVFERLGTTDFELVLGPGDALVMFTDGAVGEGRDAMAMLAPCLKEVAGATAAGLAEAVEAAARVIEPDHPDDIAVLAVRVPEEPGPELGAP